MNILNKVARINGFKDAGERAASNIIRAMKFHAKTIENYTLTSQEQLVLNKLVEAWNSFVALPVGHPNGVNEFRSTIREARILMRPTARMMNND
jgi:hypothetical protein